MSEIARVPELNAVAQKENQVDSSLRERLECRVGAPVEVLGLEDVDPPRAGWLELTVQIAENADADQD